MDEGDESKMVSETFYVTEWIDEQRLQHLYSDQTLHNHELTCISDKATIITVPRMMYQSYFRHNDSFSKMEINNYVWNVTPNLKDFNLALRNAVTNSFELLHCNKGEVLETEGSHNKSAFLVLKGEVSIFKKMVVD